MVALGFISLYQYIPLNLAIFNLSNHFLTMPHPLMYEEENFVVLETNQEEQFLTKLELLEKLQNTLSQMPIEDIPLDLRKIGSLIEQVNHLIDTTCELDLGPGRYLQWYAVRLEK
jgi:hypothetical protein